MSCSVATATFEHCSLIIYVLPIQPWMALGRRELNESIIVSSSWSQISERKSQACVMLISRSYFHWEIRKLCCCHYFWCMICESWYQGALTTLTLPRYCPSALLTRRSSYYAATTFDKRFPSLDIKVLWLPWPCQGIALPRCLRGFPLPEHSASKTTARTWASAASPRSKSSGWSPTGTSSRSSSRNSSTVSNPGSCNPTWGRWRFRRGRTACPSRRSLPTTMTPRSTRFEQFLLLLLGWWALFDLSRYWWPVELV